ncbi:CBS domain-containing protein [Streptomyces sp. NPDC006197]|uniref:CBS domain-containing protein n=1 Tax=Streptomyces sp. NPDC006197 TaxID=3156685 RepID=UPI0033A78695
MDTGGLRVCDDMTVEVALAVMAGARAGRLLVCDDDDLCTGLVTRVQLAAVRDSSVYTDRLRLRDVPGGGPLTPPPRRPSTPRATTGCLSGAS